MEIVVVVSQHINLKLLHMSLPDFIHAWLQEQGRVVNVESRFGVLPD